MTKKEHKDNFSRQSNWYVKYRPHYPSELYDHLLSRTRSFDVACDCATGNGQVACELARHFKKVYAADISQKQLANAPKANNIIYIQSAAENLSLDSKSVDLITVAQAIHWFDEKAFFDEMQRIAKPDTLLAYWGYKLPRINKTIDPLIRDFHDNVLGSFWDPERKILLNEYQSIIFPLNKLQHKRYAYAVKWDLDHIKGYLSSWSSVQHYIELKGENPVDLFLHKLKKQWPDNQLVTFPVFLTSGYIC